MARNPFVKPQTVRINLADVHRQKLAAARERLAKAVDGSVDARVLAEQVADLERDVAAAEASGDWLEVKQRLTAGEYRERLAREYTLDAETGRQVVDVRQTGFALVAAYVVDWSFVDDTGASVPFSEDALRTVDADTFREIHAAVQAHDQADDARRSEEKNVRAGSRGSEPI